VLREVSWVALRESGAAGGCEVYADGGIRIGEDALTALALGARPVFAGRPAVWALTCGGADGVRSLLAGLTDDLAHAMALAGAATVAAAEGIARCLRRSPPARWHADPAWGVTAGRRGHTVEP
jgi:isopentenyl diphosphate isomerase/L-lactate dehydrogenase-like FMN-dependent dehydrogenase